MIFAAFLLAQASFALDTTEWRASFAVQFDCRVTDLHGRVARVRARADFEEGAEGSQPFELKIDSDNELIPDAEIRRDGLGSGGLIREYAHDVMFQFPFDQGKNIGPKTWPPVLTIWQAPDEVEGDILAAGPCNVEVIEAEQ